jgi:hypothetical protein
MKKLNGPFLGLLMIATGALRAQPVDTVRELSAKETLSDFHRIFGQVLSITGGTQIGTVDVSNHSFTSVTLNDGTTDFEFILKYEAKFKGDKDICVGIINFSAEGKVEAKKTDCK